METITLPKDTLLTKAGENKKPLFKIIKGEVLIFILKKNSVIPLGKIQAGDFIGELSFFDDGPRSAYSVTLSETIVETYSQQELDQEIPVWLKEFGRSLAKKIRSNDQAISESNYRPRAIGEMIKLEPEEQKRLHTLVTQPK
jgi:CRP-like cAMP-binding protein